MKNPLTINELKQLINQKGYTRDVLKILRSDGRKGVQKLLSQYDKQIEKEKAAQKNYEEKRIFEKELYARGHSFIAGIDEAGRGPLAGPVVAAAVVLPEDFYLPGLNDSKQLSKPTREAYFDTITNNALYYGIGIIHNDEIDYINIFEATKKAMYQAISETNKKLDYALIDAVKLPKLPFPSKAIIKGDEKSVSIAASSVLAKVTRDRWMHKAAEEYPVYGFDKNMGYGTKKHLEALKIYGPSPYHRRSFAPVRNIITM